MKLKIKNAYQAQDEVVVSSDGECAEMGNPEGHRYGVRNFVFAVTATGRRFMHATFATEFGDEARAAAFAAKVEKAGVIDLEFWGETYEEYGSAAWSAADEIRAYEHAGSALRGTVRDF